MPWVGLLCVIDVFPDHTYLLSSWRKMMKHIVFFLNSIYQKCLTDCSVAQSFLRIRASRAIKQVSNDLTYMHKVVG